MAIRADELKGQPLFANLSGKDREFIAGYVDELSFGPGSALITQGTNNDRFFVLTAGEADVNVDGRPRQTLKPGSFFGEISMQRGVPATATVVARTDVRAYVMDRDQFGALSKSPAVLSHLQAAIGDRLAHDRLVSSWHQ
jgi:CRP-like cAMP-binding protein